LIDIINKITRGKFHTDIIQIVAHCSATIIVLNNVVTHKKLHNNATTTLLQDSTLISVQNSVSFASNDCLQSVRHQTDDILHSSELIDFL